MTSATFKINFSGPLVTVQDAGRPGNKRFGVAASGPMDRYAFAISNAALGNPLGATAIEVSMGGLVIECKSGTLSLCFAGGDFSLLLNNSPLPGWAVFDMQPGDKLTTRPGKSGSWGYLSFAGQLHARTWLGHTATHAPSGFGGGPILAGQDLQVNDTRRCADRIGEIPKPKSCDKFAPFRVVMGPQDHLFVPSARARFTKEPFHLTSAFDRMGVRLQGPHLELDAALSIPSEPIARGSVQVSGDGVPTVLLADHQTTGGYPKIATVIGPDMDRLCQLRAGDQLKFTQIGAKEAIVIARKAARTEQHFLQHVAIAKGSLTQRLMRENLISGAVSGLDP